MGNRVVSYTFLAAAIYVAIFFILYVPLEAAFRFARKKAAAFTEDNKAILKDLQSSLLTMVALLLAFGVSMSEIRFESRTQNLVDEGNAFSTARLHASLLPEPSRRQFEEELKKNVESRIEFYKPIPSREELNLINKKTEEAQNALWNIVNDLAQKDPHSTLFPLVLRSLDELFDVQEKQTHAYENHLPETIVGLLIVSSMFVAVGIGLECGMAGKRHFLYSNLFVLLIASTLFVIINLDRPRAGLIQIHPRNLIQLSKNWS